jgi:hypothetical protein
MPVGRVGGPKEASTAMPRVMPPTARDRQERARTLAHILTVTLDKVPGLRDALPRLRDLETGLRERGMVALNDAPLPTAEQLRRQIARLSPGDSADLQAARVQLLATIDRRRKPRRDNMPTFVSNDDLYAGEATLSQFLDELENNPAAR